MMIDRVLYPIESLGPGKRIVVWTIGCSKHCINCANPELWQQDSRKNIDLSILYIFLKEIFENNTVDGLTITGGDPFEQPRELLDLILMCKKYTKDVLVYTGYLLQELQDAENIYFQELIKNISVLIDGKYVDELNDNQCVLRGSTNQGLHIFQIDLRDKYQDYLLGGRKIQNIFYENKLISIGIHAKNCISED